LLRGYGRLWRWAGYGLLAAVLMVLAAAGVGISGNDAERLRGFVRTVDGFRANPEFRQVGVRYIHAGSGALQAGVFGVPAGRVLHTLRRLPGLPPRLAANDHLALHYQHFSEGPLSAYLHLTRQQGVWDTTGMLMELAKRPAMGDEDARGFLRSFDVWPAVVTDQGAVASVRKLMADVEAERGFVFRKPVDEMLEAHIRAIAQTKDWPLEPRLMTPSQQEAVLEELDAHVKRTSLELWRTKQVNDFLNGMWGQTFGRSYARAAQWAVWLRLAGRVEIPLLVVGLAVRTWVVRRRGRDAAAVGEELGISGQ